MKNQGTFYLGIELKHNYFDEFIACGIPVPQYVKSANFILMFKNAESYTNYINMLKMISDDLELADPENSKYEIQKSRYFIKNLLLILKNQYSKNLN